MRGVLEGFQPIVQPHHSHEEAHGVQALLVRALREGFPEEGRLEEAQGVAASHNTARSAHQEGGHKAGGDEQQLEGGRAYLVTGVITYRVPR